MKVEKINDCQIKFLLTNTDLIERGIKVSEFVFGDEKTQELFREILDQAMRECDFNTDNMPLIIEAIPVALDTISITVTKTDYLDIEARLSNLLSHISEDFDKLRQKTLSNISDNNNILIYSFGNLDDVVNLCQRIHNDFAGASSLYKNNSKYFLILESGNGCTDIRELNPILNEYGEKYIASELVKHHLMEHGELIIYSNAVGIMVNYLS